MYQGTALDLTAVANAGFVVGITASTCTIQAPDGNLTFTGGPSGTYVGVSGLADIPCLDYPGTTGSAALANEINSLHYIESLAYRTVLLQGFFEALSPDTNWGNTGWRAIITGPTGQLQTYDIRGAGCDNNQTQTWLHLRVVTA